LIRRRLDAIARPSHQVFLCVRSFFKVWAILPQTGYSQPVTLRGIRIATLFQNAAVRIAGKVPQDAQICNTHNICNDLWSSKRSQLYI